VHNARGDPHSSRPCLMLYFIAGSFSAPYPLDDLARNLDLSPREKACSRRSWLVLWMASTPVLSAARSKFSVDPVCWQGHDHTNDARA